MLDIGERIGAERNLLAVRETVEVGILFLGIGPRHEPFPGVGKPVAVGPNTENFRPVMSDLLAAQAIEQVSGAEELEATVRRWFAEGDGGLGERASKAVEARRGVVARCVSSIMEALSR